MASIFCTFVHLGDYRRVKTRNEKRERVFLLRTKKGWISYSHAKASGENCIYQF